MDCSEEPGTYMDYMWDCMTYSAVRSGASGTCMDYKLDCNAECRRKFHSLPGHPNFGSPVFPAWLICKHHRETKKNNLLTIKLPNS